MFKLIFCKIKACWYILTNNRYYLFCSKKDILNKDEINIKVLINNSDILLDKAIIKFLNK